MAADRIRNGEWMGDLELKDDLTDYLKRNWRKKRDIGLYSDKVPHVYAWSERTLSRRLQYFDIKFTDYEVDVATGYCRGSSKERIRGPGQLLGYCAMQQKLREVHGLSVPQILCTQ